MTEKNNEKRMNFGEFRDGAIQVLTESFTEGIDLHVIGPWVKASYQSVATGKYRISDLYEKYLNCCENHKIDDPFKDVITELLGRMKQDIILGLISSQPYITQRIGDSNMATITINTENFFHVLSETLSLNIKQQRQLQEILNQLESEVLTVSKVQDDFELINENSDEPLQPVQRHQEPSAIYMDITEILTPEAENALATQEQANHEILHPEDHIPTREEEKSKFVNKLRKKMEDIFYSNEFTITSENISFTATNVSLDMEDLFNRYKEAESSEEKKPLKKIAKYIETQYDNYVDEHGEPDL